MLGVRLVAGEYLVKLSNSGRSSSRLSYYVELQVTLLYNTVVQ